MDALESGRPGDALEEFAIALRDVVDDITPLLASGSAFLALGSSAHAVACYRVASYIRRNDPAALLGLARALIADDARPEAVAMLRAANDAIADPALLRELLESLGPEAPVEDVALAAHELVLLDPQDVTPSVVLAAVSVERGAYGAARRHLARASREAPGSVDLQTLRLSLYAAAGWETDLRRAVIWVPRALRGGAAHPDELVDLARVLESFGEHSLVVPLLQRATALGGGGPSTRAELLRAGTDVHLVSVALRCARRSRTEHSRVASVSQGVQQEHDDEIES